MNHLIKTTSFILLVAFIGLLGFSFVINNMNGQHASHVDCFGVGCGPIQHIVFHTFVLPNAQELSVREFNLAKTDLLTSRPAFLVKAPDTPPPQFSLV
jgi:hypothetical protein